VNVVWLMIGISLVGVFLLWVANGTRIKNTVQNTVEDWIDDVLGDDL